MNHRLPDSEKAKPLAGLVVLGLLLLAFAVPSFAQENAPLARLLHDARDFRVRVRAAFVMGHSSEPRSIAALEQALHDRHPAVRAAAATSLGNVGTPSSLAALRRLERDNEPVVREQVRQAIVQIQSRTSSATPAAVASVQSRSASPVGSVGVSFDGKHYVVVLGDVVNRSDYREPALASSLAHEVAIALAEFPDVQVFASSAAITADHAREIRARALPTLRVEGNLVRVTERESPGERLVRCEVSIMVLDERERAVRGAVSGAASRAEPPSARRDEQLRRLVQESAARAVRSALTNVRHAFAAAAAQATSGTASSVEPVPRARSARAGRKRS